MTNHDEPFTPEAVDEQIERLLQALNESQPGPPRTPTMQFVHDLQRIYRTNAEDTRALEQVWERLARHAGQAPQQHKSLIPALDNSGGSKLLSPFTTISPLPRRVARGMSATGRRRFPPLDGAQSERTACQNYKAGIPMDREVNSTEPPQRDKPARRSRLLAAVLPFAAVAALIIAAVLVFGQRRMSAPASRLPPAGKLAPQALGTVDGWHEDRIPSLSGPHQYNPGWVTGSADGHTLYLCETTPIQATSSASSAEASPAPAPESSMVIASHDDGTTWQRITFPAPFPKEAESCDGLIVDATNARHLLVWTVPPPPSPTMIANSFDGGVSWHIADVASTSLRPTGGPWDQQMLATSQMLGNTLYGIRDYTLVRSTDGGVTWQPMDHQFHVQGWSVESFALAPNSGAIMAIAVPSAMASDALANASAPATLWRLEPGSGTWERSGELPTARFSRLALASNRLYLEGYAPASSSKPSIALWQSPNNGQTWERILLPPALATAQPVAGSHALPYGQPAIAPNGDVYLAIGKGGSATAVTVYVYSAMGGGWQRFATVPVPQDQHMTPDFQAYIVGHQLWMRAGTSNGPTDIFVHALR